MKTWANVESELWNMGCARAYAANLAIEWRSVGFRPARALAWIRVGVTDPFGAIEEEECGHKPSDYED